MRLTFWLVNLYRKMAGPTAQGKYCRADRRIKVLSGTVEGLELRQLLSAGPALVNHAPAGTPTTVSGAENMPYIFKTSDFGFTDPHDSPVNQFKAVKVTLLPTAGKLADDGVNVTVTVNQFVSTVDIGQGKLTFTPVANLVGGPYFVCKFEVQDNGGTANGGIDTDPSTKVLDIKLTKVNHAPSGTSGTVTTLEDVPYGLKIADFGFKDPGDSPANTLLAVKFTLLPTAGMLTDNGNGVTVNQSVSSSDISGGKLAFTPKANLNDGPFFLCKFQILDNGGTANGGVDLDPTAKVLEIKIVSVNDPPVGTAHTVSMPENTAEIFQVADFGFTDPNDTPPNSLLAVKITTLPLLGSLTDNGAFVALGAHVPVADIMSHKLKFAAAANGAGTSYASFTFQVQDNGGTANGGVDSDPTPRTMTLSVTAPPNAPPLGTVKTVTALKSTSHVFKVSDFGFSDPGNNPPNSFLAVKMTTLPSLGSLTDNGVTIVAPGASIPATDITAGKLLFVPGTNGTGASYASFTFQVQDNGGTANGGVDTDPTPRGMTIAVTSGTVGPQTLVNTYTTGGASEPAVAADSVGNYVVVWTSIGQDGNGHGIEAQRYNPAGVAQGFPFQVNTYTTGDQRFASVAMDASGDFVIAWQSIVQDGNSYGIFAQRYNATGRAVGNEFQVNTYTTNTQDSPSVAMDAQGDFVVSWESASEDGNGNGLFAQRYSASGAQLGIEFQVNTYTSSDQEKPSIAMDAAGDFVITWMSYHQNFTGFDVYAQRYSAAGKALGGEFRVNLFTTNSQLQPSVAMDAAGDFVIAWQSNSTDGSYGRIYAQRYNAAGVIQGSEIQVNTDTTKVQIAPRAAMDADGDFVITWASNGQDGDSFGTYEQRYNSAGMIQGSELQVNTYTTGPQRFGAVAMDAEGDFVIVWTSNGPIDGGYEVYSQRFSGA